MNKSFFLSLTLSVIFLPLFATISISEAANTEKIDYEILVNKSGTHYHSPFLLKVKNISKKSLNLVLNNGLILEAKEDSYQNFIVTEELILAIMPNEEKTLPIFAMCIEEKDMAPSDDEDYRIGAEAPVDLKRLSAFIEKNKAFEPDGQFLMWEIASRRYENIDTFKMDESGNIWAVNIVGNEEQKVGFGEMIESELSQKQLLVNGEFEMNFSREKNVHIAMFNTDNVIVKELYRNPSTPIGSTILQYGFNSLDFPEEEYFVKLVVDGEVLLTRTIEMNY